MKIKAKKCLLCDADLKKGNIYFCDKCQRDRGIFVRIKAFKEKIYDPTQADWKYKGSPGRPPLKTPHKALKSKYNTLRGKARGNWGRSNDYPYSLLSLGKD